MINMLQYRCDKELNLSREKIKVHSAVILFVIVGYLNIDKYEWGFPLKDPYSLIQIYLLGEVNLAADLCLYIAL